MYSWVFVLFDAIASGIILISISGCSLLMYRNKIEFGILIWDLVILQNSFISPNDLCTDSLRFSTYRIMFLSIKTVSLPPFQSLCPLFFPAWLYWLEFPRALFIGSGVSDLGGKAPSLSPLNKMLAQGFFVCTLHQREKVSFYSLNVQSFHHEGVLDFAGCFYFIRVLWFRSFILLTRCITSVDFHMLNQNCIPRINPIGRGVWPSLYVA